HGAALDPAIGVVVDLHDDPSDGRADEAGLVLAPVEEYAKDTRGSRDPDREAALLGQRVVARLLDRAVDAGVPTPRRGAPTVVVAGLRDLVPSRVVEVHVEARH